MQWPHLRVSNGERGKSEGGLRNGENVAEAHNRGMVSTETGKNKMAVGGALKVRLSGSEWG